MPRGDVLLNVAQVCYHSLNISLAQKEPFVTLHVNITPTGRMSLPVAIRKRLGLEGGGSVLLEETDEGVVLRTVDQAVARAQAVAKRYADYPDASVDAFLANRVAESGE